MNKVVDAISRFNDWCRHAEARHPIRFYLANLAIVALVVLGVGLTLSPSTPLGASLWSVTYLVTVLGLSVFLQARRWRPGGMKRTRYERWNEPERWRASKSSWFTDPTGRHRVRYWDGATWTAWVADDGAAFIDNGPITPPASEPAPRVARPALPLLLGFVGGAPLAAGLIVAALAYPHPFDVIGGQIGTSERLGGIWLLTAAAVVVGIGASIVFAARTRVRVARFDATTVTTEEPSTIAAFGRALGACIAVGVVTAWPTWIQGWPAMFALIVLAGLVGVALVSSILAVKVARIEHRDHALLRSRGLLPALRGAFVAAGPA